MRIAQQLKRTRILLGLTQAEMIDNIMTISFYSRVEHEKHDITINDLIDILNDHHMSLYDFFSGITELRTEDQIIQDQLKLAFYEEKVDELKALKPKIRNYQLELERKLMLAILQENVDQLSPKLKQEMKYRIIKIGAWNSRSLWEFIILMSLYDYEEVKILMKIVDEKISALSLVDSRQMIALANLKLAFALRCLHENDRINAVRVLNEIDQLPFLAITFTPKILAQYYQAVIAHDQEKKQLIMNALKDFGYQFSLEGFYLCKLVTD
ncbi:MULTISPECIES: helix-turn-helix domain-containing protein [Lactobacillus]|uniref:helix-turn-helix domain-containing protein n=1 Tax=Lactobacillus TaxID=1578 RepID=UPI002490EE01|nr:MULTISPECIES: hypothetical protein [Lactobacillus]